MASTSNVLFGNYQCLVSRLLNGNQFFKCLSKTDEISRINSWIIKTKSVQRSFQFNELITLSRATSSPKRVHVLPLVLLLLLLLLLVFVFFAWMEIHLQRPCSLQAKYLLFCLNSIQYNVINIFWRLTLSIQSFKSMIRTS